jgi:transcriptional regulator with XRE-family HTH domain
MVVAERLKTLREAKNLSQGDIETRTGLLRCYVSRVENGHTVPSVETLEKFARALEVQLYQLMYDGDKPPVPLAIAKESKKHGGWESSRPGITLMRKLTPLLSKMSASDRDLILLLAAKASQKRKAKPSD